MILSKKSCPPLEDCPSKQVTIKNCCPVCGSSQTSDDLDFMDLSEKDRIMSQDTYINHPCRRECVKNAPPKTCNYKFIVSFNTIDQNLIDLNDPVFCFEEISVLICFLLG